MSVLVTLLLVACGSAPPAKQAVAAPAAPWVDGVKGWYCGSDAAASPEGAAAEGAPATRDVVVKLAPTSDSFTGLYVVQEAGRPTIGTLTRFSPTGDRAATLRSENDLEQQGDAKLSFGADYQTLTIEWSVGRFATPTTTTLSAVADPSACAAGKLLR